MPASTKEMPAGSTAGPTGTVDGYRRYKFPHWSYPWPYEWTLQATTLSPGSRDAHDAVLIRDGMNEVRWPETAATLPHMRSQCNGRSGLT